MNNVILEIKFKRGSSVSYLKTYRGSSKDIQAKYVMYENMSKEELIKSFPGLESSKGGVFIFKAYKEGSKCSKGFYRMIV